MPRETDPRRTLIPVPTLLQSARLTVRPYTLDDATAVWAAIQEETDQAAGDAPHPWRTGREHLRTEDDVRDWLVREQVRWLLREQLLMGIFLTSGGRYVGQIVLVCHDWALPRFEVGYWVRPTEEGRGYASEATRVVTGCAFETLGAQRVEILCDEKNTRSRRIAERHGFVREGLLRNHFLRRSGPSHTLVFALTPEDYLRVKDTWPE
jgi:RimJ/RimL family protein N-acetyltransferase